MLPANIVDDSACGHNNSLSEKLVSSLVSCYWHDHEFMHVTRKKELRCVCDKQIHTRINNNSICIVTTFVLCNIWFSLISSFVQSSHIEGNRVQVVHVISYLTPSSNNFILLSMSYLCR
jgi:hypothetical protein